ncbi:hypothetical protein N826_08645 [Skermanella aerolata KACC 11604]|nr:hypothetical protein N826_08645 [Skermanella aerolata KACC 11604]
MISGRYLGECSAVLVPLGQFLDGNVRSGRVMELGLLGTIGRRRDRRRDDGARACHGAIAQLIMPMQRKPPTKAALMVC